MVYNVTPFQTAILRLLGPACLAAFFFCAPALAGTIDWQTLDNKERITITMQTSEGMAGKVARIAPTGVVIPFSMVPSGLLVEKAPEGAAIFQSTKYQGRALLLLTQTAEFGFVVSKQTPSELVVDFFPNPLGARWKPSSAAPVTEIAPEFGLPEMAPQDAASAAVEADPQGAGAQSAALLVSGQAAEPGPADGGNATMAQTPPGGGNATAAPAPSGNQTGTALPRPTAPPPPDPERPKPVVVELAGTPEHASRATSMAEAPPAVVPPTATLGQSSAPGKNATGPKPLLDTRSQTAERAAALPTPEPPMNFISGPVATGVIQTTPPEQQQPTPPGPAPQAAEAKHASAPDAQPVQRPDTAAPGQAAPSAPAAAPSMPARAPGGTSGSTVGQGAAAQSAAPHENAAPAMPPQGPQAAQAPAQSNSAAQSPQAAPGGTPPPGVAVPTQAGTYSGNINLGGLEDIPSYTAGPAQGPAASAPAGTQPSAPGAAATPPPAQPAGSGATGTAATPPPAQPAATGAGTAPPAGAGATGAATAPPQGRAPQPQAQAQPQANATVIYTDEAGNPVEPPPDPVLLMPELRTLITQGQFAAALEITEDLLARGILDRDQREELLHVRAEMFFALNKDNIEEHYTRIADAANQAINFNIKSPRNAAELLRLGYMNLKLNNIAEAEARFNMLRRLFPDDENVPLSYYYWGDFHFGRGELQKAADEFQYVLQEYPNSRYARESALGLSRSFYRLGYYEESYNVVDYIERRWERFYIQYPPFLNMMGDVSFRLKKPENALRHYWLYVNLEPNGEETDIILTRMGDIYATQHEKKAAQELYTESMQRFPDKDGGLVAMMRLAEEGMFDDPTIAGMFSVYEGPFSLRPVEVYKTIIQKHPSSSLVPLSEIKLALWHLWNKEFIEALDILSDFMNKYPKHELAPRAREIAMQAFAVLSAESMQDERYGRMQDIWERYPVVREQAQSLSPESRIALGVSFRHEGKPNEALQVVEPFFLGNKIPEYSEMALSLVLSIYLEHDQWQAVREVARRVELWELKPESKQQLDYALALAAENLAEPDVAAPIWQRLYDSGKLPPSQQSYAAFFLARDAEKQRELEKAYFLGQEALSRLITQVEQQPSAADVGKIQTQLASLMDVSESAGRLREALRFAEQYLQYLKADDPERMAVRYRMARIYKKQGDNTTWQTILKEIATASPTSVYGQIATSELNAASIAEDAAKFSPTGRL